MFFFPSEIAGSVPRWQTCIQKFPEKSPDRARNGLIRIWCKAVMLLQHSQRVNVCCASYPFSRDSFFFLPLSKFLQWACSQWWLSFLFRNCTTLLGALQIPSQQTSQPDNFITLRFLHIALITILILPSHLHSWCIWYWKWQSYAASFFFCRLPFKFFYAPSVILYWSEAQKVLLWYIKSERLFIFIY